MDKILQISGAMGMGGAETLMMNIYRRADRNRVQFDFIEYTDKEMYYDSEITSLGGRVFRVRLYRDARVLKTLRALVRIMREGGYRAVHAHVSHSCGIAMLAAKIAGIPVRITHSHTTAYGEQPSAAVKLYQSLMCRLIDSCSTHFCACSAGAAEYLFNKKHAEKFTYVPNAVDFSAHFVSSEELDAAGARAQAGIPSGAVTVGHVGRFVAAKNHVFIIDVFAEFLKLFPDAYLLLVGGGDEDIMSAVQEKIRHYGIADRVCFTGVRADVARLMKAMDVFLFPSVYEGLGIALVEAQANGLRCLVSENIQPEADIGVGAVEKMNLSEGAAAWAEKLGEQLCKGRLDTRLTKSAIHSAGCDLDTVTGQLMKIYGVDG